MRVARCIFLLALLLCGCSRRQTVYLHPPINIVAGQDIVRQYGDSHLVISVKKRDGSSLEGIRIVETGPGGRESIITANTGTLTQGPKQSVEVEPPGDRTRIFIISSPVKVTLFNANEQIKTQSGTTKTFSKQWEFNFF